MPYLDNIDLVHFYKLSKLMKYVLTPRIKSIRFDVLFKMQNRDFPDEFFNRLSQQWRFESVMRLVL